MQEKLTEAVSTFNSYLTDYLLIFLLIGIGIVFTIGTKFVQIRFFGEGCRKMFKGNSGKGGISSFKALATAVAAQVGTGNIVGACGAILIGGPGAIFWMWVIAFLGMSTIYAEAVLAQKTRVANKDGNVTGGPVYYIKTAFKGKFGKFLALFFSVAAVLALGFFGAMVQSNSIAESCRNAFGIPGWATGIVISALAAFIFIGGAKRIGSVAEKLVPFMAGLYIVGGIIVICCRIQYVPETFGMIFKYAFIPQAIIGGTVGTAIKTAVSQGAKRGLFSNEAGMGSTPHAHALAEVENPHDQGVVAMIGVFIDTFIVLTMTALVVISTLYAGNGPLSECAIVPDGFAKTNMAQKAFSMIFGEGLGNAFVAVCLLLFAFSTILSWNLFGRININSLLGKKSNLIYSIIAICFIFLGTVLSNDLLWELTDAFNYLMVIPNALALIALCKLVIKENKNAAERKKNAGISK